MIGVLGFVESIVVAKLYANKYGYMVSPNRELVALGVANIVSSFFGTYHSCSFAFRTHTTTINRDTPCVSPVKHTHTHTPASNKKA